MTAPITSARVGELSSKASKGVWYQSGAAFFTNHHAENPRLGECFGRSSDDAALIAALCSEPARNRIAKALDLLEQVEAGDAVLVERVARALHNEGFCEPHDDAEWAAVWPSEKEAALVKGRIALSALVGEEVK